jgi:hypothetical protein
MTPKQTLILWCLLGQQGQAKQSEISPDVDKADRESLVAEGLISSETMKGPGRHIYIRLTDKGWRWAGEHLGDELPKAYRVLQQWLGMLHKHLAQKGDTLADFIGPAPEPPPPPLKEKKPAKPRASRSKGTVKRPRAASPPVSEKPAKPRASRSKGTVKRPRAASPKKLRARIEQAYLAITNGRKDQPAPLSQLRAELADLDRATVDAALLRILQSDEKARLGQISDPKAISAQERAAEFNPGGEPYHLLWIQS